MRLSSSEEEDEEEETSSLPSSLQGAAMGGLEPIMASSVRVEPPAGASIPAKRVLSTQRLTHSLPDSIHSSEPAKPKRAATSPVFLLLVLDLWGQGILPTAVGFGSNPDLMSLNLVNPKVN